jgi:hypothetical protein
MIPKRDFPGLLSGLHSANLGRRLDRRQKD